MFQRITAILFGIFGALSFVLVILYVWEVLNVNDSISIKLITSLVMLALIALVLNITCRLLEKNKN